MKVLLVFLVLCLTTVFPVYIGLPSTKNTYSIDDDDLMQAAIFKALSPNGAKKVDVDNYMRKKAAYSVDILSDPEVETDVAKNLKNAISELGFTNAKIEESDIFGSNVKEEGILNRFAIFLDEDTYVDTMETFVDEIADTTDVKVIYSRWD